MRKFFVISFNLLVVSVMLATLFSGAGDHWSRMVVITVLLGIQIAINIVDDIADEVI